MLRTKKRLLQSEKALFLFGAIGIQPVCALELSQTTIANDKLLFYYSYYLIYKFKVNIFAITVMLYRQQLCGGCQYSVHFSLCYSIPTMKNLSAYLVAAVLILGSLGCSKKSDSPAPSKTDLLTNKNWITTGLTVSPAFPIGGTLVTDYFAQLPSCSKDDFIRFETPAVYKEDEGSVKCTATDPQTTIGTWAFNGDQTVLTVTPQGSTAQSYNVQELTDSSLKFSVGIANGGITYTFTFTCRKG